MGGTGLYLRAALAELDLRPPVPEGRARLAGAAGEPRARRPSTPSWPAARRRSPRGIAPADGKRLVRTLELLDAGERAARDGSQLWTTDTRHPTLLAGLVMDRAALAERIGERVDRMVADGARAEVERADAPAPRPPPARRSASRSCSRATSRP